MSHDQLENAGAYLLHALDPEERAAFEAHLADCEECRAEVDGLRVAADALPSSPQQFAPPPELKHRIMAVVNSEAELLAAAGERADRVDAKAAPAAPQRRRWLLGPRIALAAVCGALGVGIVAGVLAGSNDDRTVLADTGNASLIVRNSEHSTLVARDLEGAGAGRDYQVWLLRKGASRPEPTNALFDARKDGTASVDVPGSLDDVEKVMVTSEPDGGSQQPTSDVVISASPA